MFDRILCKVIHKKVITLEDIVKTLCNAIKALCNAIKALTWVALLSIVFICIPVTSVVCAYYSIYKLDTLETEIAQLIVATWIGTTLITMLIIWFGISELYDKYKTTEIAHCPRYKKSEEK